MSRVKRVISLQIERRRDRLSEARDDRELVTSVVALPSGHGVEHTAPRVAARLCSTAMGATAPPLARRAAGR
eukprot:3429613-Prymnesium_polylepis.1